MKTVRIYRRADDRMPFVEWLEGLRDQKSRDRIEVVVARLRDGNFGDHKSVGGGINELRIHFGPGFRVYYGLDGESVVILLLGGDKSGQNKDIALARSFWKDYLARRTAP